MLTVDFQNKLGMVHAFDSSTQWKEADLSKFETNLVYRTSSTISTPPDIFQTKNQEETFGTKAIL